MKFSIICPSLNGGGAEKIAINLANKYAEQSHDVDLVILRNSGVLRELIDARVNLIVLNAASVSRSLFLLRGYIKKNRFRSYLSVMRDSNVILGLASIGLKLDKVIFREANTFDGIEQLPFTKKLLFKFLIKLTYPFADLVIANSGDTRKELVQKVGLGHDVTKAIPNPVLPENAEELYREQVAHEWFEQSETKVILSVGRLVEQKNYLNLVNIFHEVYSKNNSVRLLIIGEGALLDELIQRINLLKLENVIQILPFKKNVYPYFYKSDLFALSSKWEGFGNVLVEALGAGLPIISFDCPGGPKMILRNGKFGDLIRPDENSLFAQKVLKRLESPLCSKLELIEHSKNFKIDIISKQYMREFEVKSQ